jgi:hypothetical protein
MKKILACLILPWLLSCDEKPIESYSYWDFHPLHIGGNTLWIGKAELDSNNGDGHLYFNKNNAYFNMLVPVNRDSYFFPRVEWNNFTLNWNKNPKFNETHFNYAQFGLMFYTTGLEDWRWILRGDYNIDLKHFSHPNLYGLFSILVWGKYKIHEKWHFHVGTFATIGMETTTVYPVIGLDYSPSKSWMLEAVFPILYSVQYKLDKNWRFGVKARPLKERFRVGSHEPQPRSVFCYSTVGADLNVHYEQSLRLDIEFYAGYNFGGNFYIKNQDGKKPLYTDVGGAPYVGASLDYGF